MTFRQLALAAVVWCGAAISAQAGTVFDNLSNGSGNTYNVSALGDGPLFQSFTTGASASTMTDAYLTLLGTDGDSTGSIVITLLSDAGGVPDSVLSTLGAFSDATIFGLTGDLHISTSFALSANTTYWVQVADAFDNDTVTVNSGTLWLTANDASGTGVAGTSSWSQQNIYTYDGNQETAPFVMAIIDEVSNNNVDTPEPATIGILGLSLLGVGWARRRRAAAAAR